MDGLLLMDLYFFWFFEKVSIGNDYGSIGTPLVALVACTRGIEPNMMIGMVLFHFSTSMRVGGETNGTYQHIEHIQCSMMV